MTSSFSGRSGGYVAAIRAARPERAIVELTGGEGMPHSISRLYPIRRCCATPGWSTSSGTPKHLASAVTFDTASPRPQPKVAGSRESAQCALLMRKGTRSQIHGYGTFADQHVG